MDGHGDRWRSSVGAWRCGLRAIEFSLVRGSARIAPQVQPKAPRPVADHPLRVTRLSPRSHAARCGLRNTSPRMLAGRSGSRRRPGSRAEQRPQAPVRASSRARWTPTHTCGPWANARCRRPLGRCRSSASGSGNTAGSRLAPVIESRTRSPARDRARRRARRRRSRSGRRPLPPARAAATPRSRRPAARGHRARPRELGRVARSRCKTALAIIPSVVSIPPNSSTAALDTISSSDELRAPTPPRRAASPRRPTDHRARAAARSAREARRPSPAPADRR